MTAGIARLLVGMARDEKPSRCGTYDGVNDHYRAGEPVCRSCREAASIYQALRRRRIALGLPVKGHEADGETPRWFTIAGDLPTVGATIRRAFLESA
jgi:hypothetical protein